MYEKLEPSSRRIRLLTLAPCSGSSQIRWELKPYLLDQSPKYEALSYTWGDPTTKGTIIINERPLLVARNLLEAMQNLCHEQTGFTIWIDAICINQGNIKERNHQVGLMKDIYQNASRVIV
ncbi:heterokaryon incompatibility protein-domain-containing protein [Hyaloscypha finlandica]|nr:heterokaryon incompatibility protein-domain-containing protein [Hyaloscypha finlandica]